MPFGESLPKRVEWHGLVLYNALLTVQRSMQTADVFSLLGHLYPELGTRAANVSL